MQTVGDYTVGAAALSESDFDREVVQILAIGVTWTDESGDLQPDMDPRPLSAEGTRLPDGTVQVRFDTLDEEVVIDPRSPGAVTRLLPDGSWVTLGTLPEQMGDDTAAVALPVVRTTSGAEVLLGSESGRVDGVQERLAWAAVGVGEGEYQPEASSGDPLPALLFSGPEGLWWAHGTEPVTVEVDGAGLAWSIQEDRDLWAVQCLGPTSVGHHDPVVGEMDSASLRLAVCEDFTGPRESGYVVAVLPDDVARRAAIVQDADGASPGSVEVGESHTADLGQGQSLWVVRVSAGGQPIYELTADIEGLDLDGDGVADLPLSDEPSP